MSTEQIQRKKSKKSYEELLNEAREIASKTAAVFVPQMADALREENPQWTNQEIQDKIYLDCKGIWEEGTIYVSFPSWVHNQKSVATAKKGWETRNERKLQEAKKLFGRLNENELKPLKLRHEEEEEEPDEYIGEPMLESYGDNEESPLTVYGKINGPMRELFKALTNKELPTSTEIDLILEYLKPTREYRKGIFYEIEKDMRTYMYNAMVYTRDALNDTLKILDEIDKQEGKINE